MTAEGDGFNRFVDVQEGVVEAETVFGSPKVKHLYDWWLRTGGGTLPSRRMFYIIDHKAIVGNVFLTEVRDDGRFIFRLLGEAVIEMLGGNRTGEIVVRSGESTYGHALDAYYRRIVESRVCHRCVGLVAFPDNGFRRFESIDCPLSSDGGETVDVILGVMDLVR
jgi:hypothetical protein